MQTEIRLVDDRERTEGEGKEWLRLPLEGLKGQSPQEMAACWKEQLLQLCRLRVPELLRADRVSPEELPPQHPWFLYWLLPELIRRLAQEGLRGVWLQDYDLPLLCGLQWGFGRYSTELVSAIAESCLETGTLSCLCLTGKLPFPLPRISWPGGGERREPDEARRRYAEAILQNYFARKGKTCWEEWLLYFKEEQKKKEYTLVTEELRTLEHWRALAYYSRLEGEVPAIMRRLLGVVPGEENPQEPEIRRSVHQMANRWDCRSIQDMEALLQLLFLCRNPEGETVHKAGGRKNRRDLILITGKAGETQMQLKLSVRSPGRR